MDRTLPLFLLGLLFGGAIGFTFAAGNGYTLDGHDHSDPAQHTAGMVDHSSMDHSSMDHSTMGHGGADHAMMHDMPLEVSSDTAPTLRIMVTPDPMAGYNLHLMTENFAFSPQNASRDHVPGEGHAHVYVNDAKLGRLYSNWMHIDALPQGEVTVKVTLNSNDHRPFAVDGKNIAASTTLTVAEAGK